MKRKLSESMASGTDVCVIEALTFDVSAASRAARLQFFSSDQNRDLDAYFASKIRNCDHRMKRFPNLATAIRDMYVTPDNYLKERVLVMEALQNRLFGDGSKPTNRKVKEWFDCLGLGAFGCRLYINVRSRVTELCAEDESDNDNGSSDDEYEDSAEYVEDMDVDEAAIDEPLPTGGKEVIDGLLGLSSPSGHYSTSVTAIAPSSPPSSSLAALIDKNSLPVPNPQSRPMTREERCSFFRYDEEVKLFLASPLSQGTKAQRFRHLVDKIRGMYASCIEFVDDQDHVMDALRCHVTDDEQSPVSNQEFDQEVTQKLRSWFTTIGESVFGRHAFSASLIALRKNVSDKDGGGGCQYPEESDADHSEDYTGSVVRSLCSSLDNSDDGDDECSDDESEASSRSEHGQREDDCDECLEDESISEPEDSDDEDYSDANGSDMPGCKLTLTLRSRSKSSSSSDSDEDFDPSVVARSIRMKLFETNRDVTDYVHSLKPIDVKSAEFHRLVCKIHAEYGRPKNYLEEEAFIRRALRSHWSEAERSLSSGAQTTKLSSWFKSLGVGTFGRDVFESAYLRLRSAHFTRGSGGVDSEEDALGDDSDYCCDETGPIKKQRRDDEDAASASKLQMKNSQSLPAFGSSSRTMTNITPSRNGMTDSTKSPVNIGGKEAAKTFQASTSSCDDRDRADRMKFFSTDEDVAAFVHLERISVEDKKGRFCLLLSRVGKIMYPNPEVYMAERAEILLALSSHLNAEEQKIFTGNNGGSVRAKVGKWFTRLCSGAFGRQVLLLLTQSQTVTDANLRANYQTKAYETANTSITATTPYSNVDAETGADMDIRRASSSCARSSSQEMTLTNGSFTTPPRHPDQLTSRLDNCVSHLPRHEHGSDTASCSTDAQSVNGDAVRRQRSETSLGPSQRQIKGENNEASAIAADSQQNLQSLYALMTKYAQEKNVSMDTVVLDLTKLLIKDEK
jgi:hypothetical protein